MRHPAFTLIETMIVATIIALLGVAAWPSLSSYRKRMELEQGTQTLQGCLEMPQKLARAPLASSNTADPYPGFYQASFDNTAAAKRCTVQSLDGSGSVTADVDSFSFAGFVFSINDSTADESINIVVNTAPPYKTTVSETIGGTTTPVTDHLNINAARDPASLTTPQAKKLRVDGVTGQVTAIL